MLRDTWGSDSTVTKRMDYFTGLPIDYTFYISMGTRKCVTEGEYNLWWLD